MRYCGILSLLTHQAWEVLWMARQMLQFAIIDKDLHGLSMEKAHYEGLWKAVAVFLRSLKGLVFNAWVGCWRRVAEAYHSAAEIKDACSLLGFPVFFMGFPHKILQCVFFSFNWAKKRIFTKNAWKVTDPMLPGLCSSKDLGSILFSRGYRAKYGNAGVRVWPRLISAHISLRSIQLVLFITAAWSQNDNSSSAKRIPVFFFFFVLIWFFLAQLVL